MHETSQLLAIIIVLLGVAEGAAPSAAEDVTTASRPMQTPLQLPAFNSIEVPNGGHVVLRAAQKQSVTLLKGSLDCTRVAVTNGGVLVIDNVSIERRKLRLLLAVSNTSS